MGGHRGFDTPTPVVYTADTSNEVIAARTAAAAGTVDPAVIAAAEAAHEADLARELAAEEARVARAIEAARTAITAATAASVQANLPDVITSAEEILRQSQAATTAFDRAVASLVVIFPDLDIEPWMTLGSKDWFEGKEYSFNRMYAGWYQLGTGAAADSRNKYWNTTSTADQRSRLPYDVLSDTAVQKHLFQKNDITSTQFGGPADLNPYYDWSAYRWSWVSALDRTFSAQVADFGWYRAAGEDENSVYGGTRSYPHGWLTNLEMAMGMIGYFRQGSDPDLPCSTRTASDTNHRYEMFSERDVGYLGRESGGDIELGWKTIMDANHSDTYSWTIYGRLPHGFTSSTGDWEEDARQFLQRTFSDPEQRNCNAAFQLNDNMTSTYSKASAILREDRIYGILRNGGKMQQLLYTSWNTHGSHGGTLENDGWTYACEGSWGNHPFGRAGVSKKLKADADRFAAMADWTDLESAPVLAHVLMNSGYSEGSTPTSVQENANSLIENSTFDKLARVLRSIAAVLDSNLMSIETESKKLRDSHRNTIIATCNAIEEQIDFESDNRWFDFDDGWNDDLGDDVLEGLGNPYDSLTASFIGSGQTSVMFKEQCFLLSFISDLALTKKTYLDRYDQESDAAYIGHIATRAKKNLPYFPSTRNVTSRNSNASIIMDGSSYGFLNKLTQNPRLGRLYDALNHELSNLQPKIRLWKVIFDDEGKEQEVEIKFETHFSSADLDFFKSSDARGVGAGLKSFNFVYDGSNPFAVKKSIKANLKIFANTMSELLRDRPSHYYDSDDTRQSTTYKYVDLAMKTWNTANEGESAPADEEAAVPGCLPHFDLLEENVVNQELNFRLKAQVGFEVPLNDMNSIDEELREALAESFVTLNLTPTVHNFEIDEQGRVLFNLNYLAYIEQFFDQALFNVFSSSSITLNRMARNLVMRHYRTTDCSSDQINQAKDDFAADVKAEQEQAISHLLAEMMANDQIYYINMPYEKITRFISHGPQASYDDIAGDSGVTIMNNTSHNAVLQAQVDGALSTAFAAAESTETGVDDNNRSAIQAALLGNDPAHYDLAFFYLSDLVDSVLLNIETGLDDSIEDINDLDSRSSIPHSNVITCEQMKAKEKNLLAAKSGFKKLRIMLGPIEFTHPQAHEGHESTHVSLGDVPISVRYFVEWLTNKMLQKDEVTYPLTKFLNDLVNGLLSNFLNNDNCFGYSVRQKARLNQSAVSSYGSHATQDPVTRHIALLHHGIAGDVVELSDEMYTRINSMETFPFRGNVSHFEHLPILNPSGPANSARTTVSAANEYNFFVYFAGRVMPTELMLGNKQEDENNFGIFHYMLGRDRGLVKNIKLTKTQTKGLAEVRFEQEGYDGLEQLRVVYDAQVDMFASVNTFPGCYIYIDPRGFAPEMAGGDQYRMTDLGVGGYYMIVRSEHEFGEGKANTILHTKWVNQVDRSAEEAEASTQQVESTSGTGGTTSRRCQIRLRPDPGQDEPETPGFLSMFGF